MNVSMFNYKFIYLGRDNDLDEHEGKPIWYIFNRKSRQALGRVLYYPAWRQWVASFSEDSIWSAGCLTDVKDAIGLLGKGLTP